MNQNLSPHFRNRVKRGFIYISIFGGGGRIISQDKSYIANLVFFFFLLGKKKEKKLWQFFKLSQSCANQRNALSFALGSVPQSHSTIWAKADPFVSFRYFDSVRRCEDALLLSGTIEFYRTPQSSEMLFLFSDIGHKDEFRVYI